MIYTLKIKKAIDFATWVHRDQKRKGKEAPYIIHPLGVGLILSKVGAKEDVIIAGILHDTLEDSQGEDKSNVHKFIQEEFGKTVYKMVNDVTEQDKTLPWKERKRLALEHMDQMDQDSLLIKSADVLYNVTDLVSDIEEKGDSVFLNFNAPKEKQFELYKKLLNIFERTWSENPLLSDIKVNIDKLLKNGKK